MLKNKNPIKAETLLILNNSSDETIVDHLTQCIKNQDENYVIYIRNLLAKNKIEIVKKLIVQTKKNKWSYSFLDLFKVVVSFGSVDLAQWMHNEKLVDLSHDKGIIEACFNSKSMLKDNKNPEQKTAMIKWLLPFSGIQKELNNPKVYLGAVSRTVDIVLMLLEDAKHRDNFKNIWDGVIFKIGQFDNVNMLKKVLEKNYFSIDNNLWKKLVMRSIIGDSFKVCTYGLNQEPSVKIEVQKLINRKKDAVLWSQEKYTWLENNGFEFFETPYFYSKVLSLVEQNANPRTSRFFSLLNVLEFVKDKVMGHPEIMAAVLKNPVDEYHLNDFLKVKQYYDLTTKIALTPENKKFAKRNKI
jgi:hypothetical protein